MVLKLHTFPLIEGQNQYRLFEKFLYGMPDHRSISNKNDKGLFHAMETQRTANDTRKITMALETAGMCC